MMRHGAVRDAGSHLRKGASHHVSVELADAFCEMLVSVMGEDRGKKWRLDCQTDALKDVAEGSWCCSGVLHLKSFLKDRDVKE